MKLAKLNDPRFHMALTRLMAQPMPLKLAFKLKGINARVQEEGRKLEEVRQGALQRYGKKDEKNELVLDEHENVVFEKDQLAAFAKELNELGTTEIQVGTLSLEDLGEKFSISPEDVMALDGLLVE